MLWVLFPRIQTQLRNHFARRKYEADIDLYQWFQVIRYDLKINDNEFLTQFWLISFEMKLLTLSLLSVVVNIWLLTIWALQFLPLFSYLGVKILFGECRGLDHHGTFSRRRNLGEGQRTKKFRKGMLLLLGRNSWYHWSGAYLKKMKCICKTIVEKI